MINLSEIRTETILDMTKPSGYVTFLNKDKLLAIKCKVIFQFHFT
jgi:hypothetical protein